MRLSLTVCLAAVLSVAANAPSSDMGKLEGRWYGGVWTFNGSPAFVVNQKDPISVLDITENTATLRTRKGPSICWSYSAIPNGTPKFIDLTVTDGAEKGKVQRGIYNIESKGEGWYHLRICVAKQGADRPERFVDKPEDGTQVFTFARYPTAP